MYSLRTQPPPIRHPWLSGGLFEHRVQTLLILTEHQVLLSSKHMYILRLRYEFISIIRRASVFTVLDYANSLHLRLYMKEIVKSST